MIFRKGINYIFFFNKYFIKSLIILPLLLVFIQCANKNYLKSNEYLLKKQSFEGNKKFNFSDLNILLSPQPNRSLLGVRLYLMMYQIGFNHFDTLNAQRQRKKVLEKYNHKLRTLNDSLYLDALNKDEVYDNALDSVHYKSKYFKKLISTRKKRTNKLNKADEKISKGNWMMRVVGEPPSIFDSSSIQVNLNTLHNFYFNQGYLENQISCQIDTNKRDISLKFKIIEKSPYKIITFTTQTNDTSISNLIKKNNKESYIKINNFYKEQDLTNERDRINRLLRNSGYFDFNPQYISFDIDSSQIKREINITTIISNTSDGKNHKRYTFDKVYFFTDQGNTSVKKDTGYYRNIYFIYTKQNFSKRIISKKLLIKEKEYYNVSKIQNSQRQLAALDMYKFININFEKTNDSDTLHPKLTAYVRTMPLQKFQSTEEVGLSMASNFVPGPSGFLNFKSRNTLRGFEIFETSFRATVVGQASLLNKSEFYRSEEYNAQTSMSFPQLYFPMGRKFQNFIENYSPVTRFDVSYSYIGRPEYTRDNINVGMNYNFQLSPRKLFSFAIVDLNLVSTKNKSASFVEYLNKLQNNGNNLINSFGTSFVSDMNATYTFTNNVLGENKKSKYLRIYAESGGTLLNILNKNNLLVESDTLLGLKTFRYFKLSTDLRLYFPIRKNTFAMKYNIGVAKAYDNEEILPYERNFFLGGSNSIRSWSPRRLGPGGWVAERDEQGRPIYRFEQPGSIMLEMSWEYRFKIIKFLESALFVDAGNLWIWAPRNGVEKARPEGVFYFDKFLSQIAVGTGLGIRLNFSFLILRFDFGWKAKDPSQEEGKRWIFFKEGYRSPNLNLSIGYPF